MNLLRIPGFFLALLRAILVLPPIAIFVLGYIILTSLRIVKHNAKNAYKLRRMYIRLIIPILGIRIEKEGEPHNEPALYLCNHRSFSDPVILLRYLDAYVIAKAEVADYPFLNKGAELTGIIYVKRDSKDSRKATRKAFVDTVKNGLNVLVYPEGTTNDQLRTMPYRPGTFVEAAENDLPVVPVTLEYKTKWDMWKDRGLFQQFFYQYWKLTTPVKLKFGKAYQSDDFKYLQESCENWTNETIAEMHKGWGSHFSKAKIEA